MPSFLYSWAVVLVVVWGKRKALPNGRLCLMSPLELVKLRALMDRTSGRAEIAVGLIDGPVAIDHPDLIRDNIREIPGKFSSVCAQAGSVACLHGTFVAGILCAKRSSIAPAICPDCALLVNTFAKIDQLARASVGS